MEKELLPVPTHVAIIMDGNGRWAKMRGMPRTYGHAAGAKRVEPTVRKAKDLGIKYLTFYAFSTENWNRPEKEVSTLMSLLARYMKICEDLSVKENIRSRIIGDKNGLPENLRKAADHLEETTKDNTAMGLQICINYGSRDEMIRAMRKMYQDMKENDLDENAITEEYYEQFLDTAGIPDPDLMIRTSGEQRLSNYLMWQMAYAEFYFTDKAWPDFDDEELEKAVMAYRTRDRRYGKV